MEEQIKELEDQLTGEMMHDMDIRQKIHELQMEKNEVEPNTDFFQCIDCGG